MPRKTNFTANNHAYYRVTATVGHSVEGAPIRKQFYGSGQREAEAKRDEYLAGINQGLPVNFDKALFGAVFKAWFENVLRPAVAASSYRRYETDYKIRIKNSALAGIKLADIRATNIQACYNDMLENYSANAVRNVNKLLSASSHTALKPICS